MSGDRLRELFEEHIGALLAEAQPASPPEPVGPTDEEWDLEKQHIWCTHKCTTHEGTEVVDEVDFMRALDDARATLTSWGRPAPVPVSVDERLPTAQDCEEGEVWVEEVGSIYAIADTGDYDWEPHRYVLRALSEWDMKRRRRWLPHWALPVPQEQADYNHNS